MIAFYYLIGCLFVVAGFGCLVLVVAQLPGTWVMLILATLFHLADVYWVLPDMDGAATGNPVMAAMLSGFLVGRHEGLLSPQNGSQRCFFENFI